jgi:hypothetical protein
VTGKVVAVLAFKTVYTLEQKRRDNDKKVISLHIGMKDMMGSLFLCVNSSIQPNILTSRSLNGMEDDKLVAPDGTNIEDRLKALVERTADDIKACWNVCDAYMKKRPLAKVLLSSLWDAKLLDFVELFATRRREFEFELTRHASQGIDKANVKLDLVGSATKEIKEQFGSLYLCSGYALISWYQDQFYEGIVRAISQPRTETALGPREGERWHKSSPERRQDVA